MDGLLSLFFVLACWCFVAIRVLWTTNIPHTNIIITYEQGLTRGWGDWPQATGQPRWGRRGQTQPLQRIYARTGFLVEEQGWGGGIRGRVTPFQIVKVTAQAESEGKADWAEHKTKDADILTGQATRWNFSEGQSKEEDVRNRVEQNWRRGWVGEIEEVRGAETTNWNSWL